MKLLDTKIYEVVVMDCGQYEQTTLWTNKENAIKARDYADSFFGYTTELTEYTLGDWLNENRAKFSERELLDMVLGNTDSEDIIRQLNEE